MGAFGVTEKPAEPWTSSRSCSADLPRWRKPRPAPPTGRRRRRGRRAKPASVPELAGAKMLIVDDDIRNIYSLTSVLESHDVEVLHAERGRTAS